MPLVTLTTDFGIKDHYIGALKGAMMAAVEGIQIVDISHHIQPYHIAECAYVLKNAYRHFPKGSIHIVGVDTQWTEENRHILVLVDGHYFITANNGVIALITQEITPDQVYEINMPQMERNTFPTLYVFAPVATHLARGGTPELIGKPFTRLKERAEFKARISDDGSTLFGHVLYIDNYGNAITNISKPFFEACRKNRSFELSARSARTTRISQGYGDIGTGQEANLRTGGHLVCLFNTAHFLEIAIAQGSAQNGGASSLLGLQYRDQITVQFFT